MTNPFENPDGVYYALLNEEGQYSLWPVFAEIPAGWRIACGPGDRKVCLDYIERSWADMRPASLIRATERAAAASGLPGPGPGPDPSQDNDHG